MGLNDVVSAERLHIAFFGLRNAGKSSLVNAVTGQDLSVVSDVLGTTTDPVRKAMELLPLGPVLIIDTPGFDDSGSLGELRVRKTARVLAQTDIAILVVDAALGRQPGDEEMIALFKARKIPYLVALNKADLLADRPAPAAEEIYVSSVSGENINELKDRIGALRPEGSGEKLIVCDRLAPGSVVVLVIPIDESAPKGRIILPQQMVLRELLDHHMSVLVCQAVDLSVTLAGLVRKPDLVITDSQAFKSVAADTPEDVLLTSFSILMARYKGNLRQLTLGASKLLALTDQDRVLISEGCSHHRQCGDIGTVKMPAWIRQRTGASPALAFTSGGDFPADLSDTDLVIHCGGCMLNEKEMQHRLQVAEAADVPVVNYGIAIAAMHGILRRSLEIFPELTALLEEE